MTIVVGAAVTDAATDAQAIARGVEISVTVRVVLPGVTVRLPGPMPSSKPMVLPVQKQALHVRPALQDLRVSPGLHKRHAHLALPGLPVLHRDRKAQVSFAWC
jgi:hypothetical protein